jgi:hypothetical protein
MIGKRFDVFSKDFIDFVKKEKVRVLVIFDNNSITENDASIIKERLMSECSDIQFIEFFILKPRWGIGQLHTIDLMFSNWYESALKEVTTKFVMYDEVTVVFHSSLDSLL